MNMGWPQDKLLPTLEKVISQTNDLLINSTPNNHESFFTKFSISNENRLDFVRSTLSRCSKRLSATDGKRLAVPNIIHRIWLTDPAEPRFPSELYLKKIAKQAAQWGDEYDYIFWHNSDSVETELARFFAGARVQFRNLERTFLGSELLLPISLAISVKKFVLAGDISKYLVLKDFGGVYADLGIDFDADLLNLVRSLDVALFLDAGLFFQPAFMATAPAAKPFRLWCKLLAKPEVVSAIGLSGHSRFTYGSEIWAHGGVGFTALLMLFYDYSYDILSISPNRGLLHHESEGSWYKPGNKFGNAKVDEAEVTHLNWSKHLNYLQSKNELERYLSGWKPGNIIRTSIMSQINDLYWLE